LTARDIRLQRLTDYLVYSGKSVAFESYPGTRREKSRLNMIHDLNEYFLLFCKFSCLGEYHGDIALTTNASAHARSIGYWTLALTKEFLDAIPHRIQGAG
jgi:hypothetical protein